MAQKEELLKKAIIKFIKPEEELAEQGLSIAKKEVKEAVEKEAAPAVEKAINDFKQEAKAATSAESKATEGIVQKEQAGKKGAGQETAQTKAPSPPIADTAKVASNLNTILTLTQDAIAAVKKHSHELATRLEPLLSFEDWQNIMTRIYDRLEQADSLRSYAGKVSTIQGALLERIIPKLPEYKLALEEAGERAARVGLGKWSEVRPALVVKAWGEDGERLFSDFVFWAEGLDKDNKGFTLLLTFIEAKAGASTDLFREVIRTSGGKIIQVGQLGRIQERLRYVITLDGRKLSFENMVYLLPSSKLDPAQRLTEYITVMQRAPTKQNLVDLLVQQELNATPWLSPVKRLELRKLADIMLRIAGKAPK